MTQVRADDGAESNHPTVENNFTDSLRCTGFGFILPQSVTINGIVARVKCVHDTAGAVNPRIRKIMLIKSGTWSSTEKEVDTAVAQGSYTTVNPGSASDLWGLTFTKAQIEASDFGVGVQFICDTGGGGTAFGVDYISITVHYTIIATGAAAAAFALL